MNSGSGSSSGRNQQPEFSYLFKDRKCPENNNIGGSVSLSDLANTWSEMSKTDKRSILNNIKEKSRQHA